MNNKLFILPLLAAAVALPSCDNKEDQIFSDDASTRLEQAKKEYAELLTSDGGKWLMEYFSNGDEPGYTLGLEFDKDGSVNVSGNHKWLDNKYTEDRSLFELLADDGPVLSFNSYNDVFHQFSDPVNITGPDAPVDEDRDNEDIDETGYGHNGDYEFNVMYVSEKSDSVRLRGKKRGITHWLIRLPADTDMEQYLTDYKAKADGMFSSKFNTLEITAADGEKFVLTDAYKGVMSVYPKAGDAVSQTAKKNAIITDKGIRFMDKFSVHRADNKADMIEFTSFVLQPDGTLLSADGSRVSGLSLVEYLNSISNIWRIDEESFTGELRTLLDRLKADCASAWNGKRDFRYVELNRRTLSGKGMLPVVKVQLGSYAAEFYYTYNEKEGSDVTMNAEGETSNTRTFIKTVPVLGEFGEKLIGASYKVSASNSINPREITFEGTAGNFVVRLQD